MKKAIVFALCALLGLQGIVSVSASSFTEASAANPSSLLCREETVLDNGLTVVDEILEYSIARSTDKLGERRLTIKSGDNVIGIIAFQAVFRYDGSTVSVVSKTVTQTDTYRGYNYKQQSFTSSGGSVTLEGKLTKLLVINHSFTMTLNCDKNGNLSY